MKDYSLPRLNDKYVDILKMKTQIQSFYFWIFPLSRNNLDV